MGAIAARRYEGHYASSTMMHITNSRRLNSPIGCACECTLTLDMRHHYMVSLGNVTKVQLK